MFGGSFNPVHIAHREFAQTIIEQGELDKLLIIPTYTSPHKPGEAMVSAADRYAMCRLAFARIPRTEVSDMEICRRGKSFTVDTLRHLKEQYPRDRLFLAVGADMYVTLQDWKSPEEIFSLADIIALPRDHANYEVLLKHAKVLEKMGARSVILKQPVTQLSASCIREKIKKEENVRELLDPDVYAYIAEHKLYGM